MDKYEIIMRVALIVAGLSLAIVADKLDKSLMMVAILKKKDMPSDTCLKWALLGVLVIFIGLTRIIF